MAGFKIHPSLITLLICFPFFSVSQQGNTKIILRAGINCNGTKGEALPNDFYVTDNTLPGELKLLQPDRLFTSTYLAAGFKSINQKGFGFYLGAAYSQTGYKVYYYSKLSLGSQYHSSLNVTEGTFELVNKNLRIEFDLLYNIKGFCLRLGLFNPEVTFPKIENESIQQGIYRTDMNSGQNHLISRSDFKMEKTPFTSHFFSSATFGIDYNLKFRNRVFPFGIIGFHSWRGAYYGFRVYSGYCF